MSYVYLSVDSLTLEDSLTIRDAIVLIASSRMVDWLESKDNTKTYAQIHDIVDTLLTFARDIDKEITKKSTESKAD